MQQTTPEVHPDAGRSTHFSATLPPISGFGRRPWPRERFHLVNTIQRGNHDLTKANNLETLVANASNLWQEGSPACAGWTLDAAWLRSAELRREEMRNATGNKIVSIRCCSWYRLGSGIAADAGTGALRIAADNPGTCNLGQSVGRSLHQLRHQLF